MRAEYLNGDYFPRNYFGYIVIDEFHHNAGVYRQEEAIKVQYFAIGEWCICGAPYELMVEFVLEPMEKSDNPFFYVNGYTNTWLVSNAKEK